MTLTKTAIVTLNKNKNNFELANRKTRFLAFVVDFLLQGIFFISLFIWIFLSLFLEHEGIYNNHILIIQKIFPFLIQFYLLIGILNLILLYRNGQTFGKYLFAIKIVRVNGSRVGLLRIVLVRYSLWWAMLCFYQFGFLLLFLSLLDSLLIFQNSKQCWHDLIADTIVIKIT